MRAADAVLFLFQKPLDGDMVTWYHWFQGGEQMAETRLRCPDEEYEEVRKLVYSKKYSSNNDFFVQAIKEKLERERQEQN